eukprot:COSAG02_NODE_2492_length_8691_cov_45.293412_3_plen_82_part_00
MQPVILISASEAVRGIATVFLSEFSYGSQRNPTRNREAVAGVWSPCFDRRVPIGWGGGGSAMGVLMQVGLWALLGLCGKCK